MHVIRLKATVFEFSVTYPPPAINFITSCIALISKRSILQTLNWTLAASVFKIMLREEI